MMLFSRIAINVEREKTVPLRQGDFSLSFRGLHTPEGPGTGQKAANALTAGERQ